MNCPKCESKETRVYTTEKREDATWRFKKCLDCGKRFKTIEVLGAIDTPVYCSNRYEAHRQRGRDLGRMARGEEAHNTFLTEQDVVAMRRLYAQGYSTIKLSNIFGMSKSGVQSIISRKTWDHVPDSMETSQNASN